MWHILDKLLPRCPPAAGFTLRHSLHNKTHSWLYSFIVGSVYSRGTYIIDEYIIYSCCLLGDDSYLLINVLISTALHFTTLFILVC